MTTYHAAPETHKPKHWRALVLDAIRGVTGNETLAVAHWDAVTTMIETLCPDLDWDSYGVTTKDYPQSLRAVTLTALKLRDEGLICTPKRRHYGLTSAGIDQTRSYGSHVVEGAGDAAMMGKVELAVVNETPETPAVATEAPVLRVVEEEVAPAILPEPGTHSTGEGYSWTPPEVGETTNEIYAEDAYLRRIAMEQARCFGAWSKRAPACKACPLASMCRSAVAGPLTDIGATLDAELEKALAPAPEEPAEEAAEVPYERAEETGREMMALMEANPTWSLVDVPFESVCTECGGTIGEGTHGMHIPQAGFFHPACAQKMSAAETETTGGAE